MVFARSLFQYVAIALLALLWHSTAVAAPVATDARLARGVNFYLHPGVVNGRLVGLDDPINAFTDADAAKLKALGMTHLRLAVVPYPLLDGVMPTDVAFHAPLARRYLSHVHGIVARAQAAGLTVVLAVMAGEDLYRDLQQFPAHAALWDDFWRRWAQEFGQYPAETTVFETWNEPRFAQLDAGEGNVPTEAQIQTASLHWNTLQQRWLTVLRTAMPHHTLVAVGDDLASIRGLVALTPTEDANVVYAFHYYHPFAFTHQGAPWAGMEDVRGLSYPPNSANINGLVHFTRTSVRHQLQHYARWQQQKNPHATMLAPVLQWARAHPQAKLWVSEFGAFPAHATGDSALNYLRDTRTALEAAGLGWCAWEYAGWLGGLKDAAVRGALAHTP